MEQPLVNPPSTAADELLELTVHTAPGGHSPQTDSPTLQAARTRRGRWMMWVVLAACLSPVVASYFTFYVIKPKGGNSYGTVLPLGPQAEIPPVQAHNLAGEPVALRSLRGQWVLLSVASGACPARCQEHLYLQRQIREMLGREKERVDWVWLVNDKAAIAPPLQAAAAQAGALRVEEAQIASWLIPAAGQRVEDHLYLLDPMGNAMMRFPADLEPKKAYKDLNRLLRASASWDRVGR